MVCNTEVLHDRFYCILLQTTNNKARKLFDSVLQLLKKIYIAINLQFFVMRVSILILQNTFALANATHLYINRSLVY